jgi:hypothetical protein
VSQLIECGAHRGRLGDRVAAVLGWH